MKASTSILLVGAFASIAGFASATAVQAAPPPFFPMFHFGMNVGPHDDFRMHDACQDDRQISRDLRDQGYSHVEEVDQSRHTLTFDASMGMRMYELVVDSCSGDILSKTRLHNSH